MKRQISRANGTKCGRPRKHLATNPADSIELPRTHDVELRYLSMSNCTR